MFPFFDSMVLILRLFSLEGAKAMFRAKSTRMGFKNFNEIQ